MADFFKWLSKNPFATRIMLVAMSIMLVAICLVVIFFVVAFLQGREVIIWPPKIGPKPVVTKEEISTHQGNDAGPGKQESTRIEVPFTCQIGGKLHIYKDAKGPINAGIPSNANIHIISEQSSATIANELVELSDGVQSIEQLKFIITYEYHADLTESSAILEFVIKDKDDNQIWRGIHSFLPRGATKQKITNEFSFNISRRYAGQKVIVQVKPLAAGDFGFYIYSLDGKLVVKAKQST